MEKVDEAGLVRALEGMAEALESIVACLERMPEHCDPYIYYPRVRPFIHGGKGHSPLPNSLVYAGVPAYGESPQYFRGETGAQSPILPLLDTLLGIEV